MLIDNLFRCLDTVQNRHADVHDHHIGLERGRSLDRVTSVLGFTDNFQVGLAVEQGAQARSHHRVVVSKQSPQFFHDATLSRFSGVLSSGRSTRRDVPRPATESTFKIPFNWLTRSVMPTNPNPRARTGSKPLPSS